MPTATVPKPSKAGGETFDLRTLEHLTAHPDLAPLLARRSALRQRLTAIRDEHTAHRRQVYALRDVDDFSASATRRQAQDAIEQLEREGAGIEGELRTLQGEIDTTEAAVKAQLVPLLAQDGLPIARAVVEALDHLHEALSAYQAYGERCRHVYGSPLVHVNYGTIYLPNCIRMAQQDLERLERLAGQAAEKE